MATSIGKHDPILSCGGQVLEEGDQDNSAMTMLDLGGCRWRCKDNTYLTRNNQGCSLTARRQGCLLSNMVKPAIGNY